MKYTHLENVVTELQKNFHSFFKSNANLIAIFSFILISAYGFELFNLNLTIDEEVFGAIDHLDIYISTGRWGQYLLAKYLLPQPVIPFVPLFISLAFMLGAVFLLLNNWRVASEIDRIIIGSITLAFPSMAFMYTFSPINFGIGIALFCASLSLSIYTKFDGLRSFYGILPAALAIGIYQGIAIVLPTIFLISLIACYFQAGNQTILWRQVVRIATFILLSLALYLFIAKSTLALIEHELWYVDSYFDFYQIFGDFHNAFGRTLNDMKAVYLGDSTKFGSTLALLPYLILLSIIGFAINLHKIKLTFATKFSLACLYVLVIVLPFLPGLVMKGHMSMRFLLGIPFTLGGVIALGVAYRSKVSKLFFSFLSVICLYQFVVSTNTLFSSSALALEADRSLASRLLSGIYAAQQEEGMKHPVFFEVVGKLSREGNRLTPKIETFGASFFEWDGGSSGRILFFLNTLEKQKLQQLPDSRKKEFVEFASSMPEWPNQGSIKVRGDTLIIKLSPYTEQQLLYLNANGQY